MVAALLVPILLSARFSMSSGARSILLPVILIVVVDVLAFTMILPLLPFYAEHFGATPAQVGALTSVFALGSLLAGPVLGRWSDRYGRRRVLLLSQAGTLTGLLIVAGAPSLSWVFAGRIVAGLTAGNLAVAQATIADVTEPSRRARVFGLIGAAFGLGFLIGPGISALLVKFGFVAPLLGAAALSMVSIGCTLRFIPRRTRASDAPAAAPPTRRALLATPGLRGLLAQFFGFTLSFSTFTAGLALFCERRYTWNGHAFGASEVGFVFAAVGFWGLIVQGGLIRPLLKRMGEQRLATLGCLLAALGFALLAPGGGSLWLFALSAVVSGLGTGVVRPSLMGLISQTVSQDAQGVVIGLTQSLQSGSMVIGGLLSGFLIHQGALAAYALAAAGFIAAAGALGGLRGQRKS